MKNFVWNDTYDVKVEKFNNQHKHLFEIVKELYVAMENKDDKDALAKIIEKLISYSREHFTDEEMSLLRTQYPNYEKHRKEHKLFIERVGKLAEDFESGKQLLHFDILCLLKNWVSQHILVCDKNYGEYLNSKGIF